MENSAPAPGGGAPEVRFSVIVPAHNRQKLLSRCVTALTRLEGPSFEVIVVDDGSEPPLELPETPAGFPIRLIRQDNRGPGAARNTGAAAARGTYLAFTDDDCQPDTRWLQGFEEALREDAGAVLGGTTVNAETDNVYAAFNQALAAAVEEAARSGLRFYPTNNLCIARSEFERLGGFDARFQGAGGEDRELGERAAMAGLSLRAAPAARVCHYHAQTWRSFWAMHVRYGAAARLVAERREQTNAARLSRVALAAATLRRTGARGTALYLVSQAATARGYYRAQLAEGMRLLACYSVYVLLLAAVFYPLRVVEAEFGGSDEAAHVVTGLMVRDYLLHGIGRLSPLGFAQDYYDHYPKVAIGHWPPVFYIVQVGWMSVAGVSRTSILILSAALTALLGLLAAWLCRREGLPWWLALSTGAVTVLLPESLRSCVQVGSDAITAAATLVAALVGGRFLARLDLQWGTLFGASAAIAVLTKGTAFALALAAPLAAVATRGRTVLRASFWWPAAVVLMLAGPWYWISLPYVAGEVAPGETQNLTERMLFSFRANLIGLMELGGVAITAAAAYSLRAGWQSRWPVLAALPVSLVLFLSFLSPHSDRRLMLAAVPVLCWAAALLSPRAVAAGVLATGLVVAHARDPIRAKPRAGFVEAVAWAETRGLLAERVLITSNGEGEGGWISETALRRPRPTPSGAVVRASKIFAVSTWMGKNRRLLVHDAAGVRAAMARARVDWVAVHRDPALPEADYQPWLNSALEQWGEEARFGKVTIYRKPRPQPAAAP